MASAEREGTVRSGWDGSVIPRGAASASGSPMREQELKEMKKTLKWSIMTRALASSSTLYVSCSTAIGTAFRDAAIDGAAGVIEETVAGLFAALLDPVDGAE